MSVVVMVNEKFREGVPPWEVMNLIIKFYAQNWIKRLKFLLTCNLHDFCTIFKFIVSSRFL